MGKKFLQFLEKYWFCILLSAIMVIGLFLSTFFADLYECGRGYIRFDLREMYLIFGLPIYSLIYGCLSYIKTKKYGFLSYFFVVFLFYIGLDLI